MSEPSTERLRTLLSELFSRKRAYSVGVHGQVVGEESYRLVFCGKEEGAILEALDDLTMDLSRLKTNPMVTK